MASPAEAFEKLVGKYGWRGARVVLVVEDPLVGADEFVDAAAELFASSRNGGVGFEFRVSAAGDEYVLNVPAGERPAVTVKVSLAGRGGDGSECVEPISGTGSGGVVLMMSAVRDPAPRGVVRASFVADRGDVEGFASRLAAVVEAARAALRRAEEMACGGGF